MALLKPLNHNLGFMIKILIFQAIGLAVVAMFSGILAGMPAFWSAVAGGLSYLVPTAVAILFLSFLKPYPQMAAKGLLIGEGLKIVLALIIMLLVFYVWHQQLMFIPFILGLIVVSQLVFLVSWKVQRYGK